MASMTGKAGRRTEQRAGRIIIVRHGRPNLDRNAGPRLNWREYRKWWAAYERAPLDDGQAPPKRLLHVAKDVRHIFSSVRPRAFETAQAIAGDRAIVQDEVFVEAPLPPPHWSEKRRYLPKTWNKIARVAWLFGWSDEDESIEDAKRRASAAAEKLIAAAEEGGDVLLAAHGWFNRMLRPEMKKRGWACRRDGGDSYWSFRVYEKL